MTWPFASDSGVAPKLAGQNFFSRWLYPFSRPAALGWWRRTGVAGIFHAADLELASPREVAPAMTDLRRSRKNEKNSNPVSRSLIQTLAAAAWSPDQPHAKRCQTDRVTPYCNQAIVFHRFRMLWMKQLFDLVQLMPQIGWLV